MRSKISGVVALLPGFLALLGSGGCGGGGFAFSDLTRIEGTLDQNDSRFSDGSVSDFYVAKARRGGRATIEMQSSRFDPYLIVSAANSDGEIENIIEDNDSGGDKNARVTFEVKAGKTYFIAALDDSGVDNPGTYTVIFSEILTDVRENPDAELPIP